MMTTRFLPLLACGVALFCLPANGEASDAACSANGDVLYRLNYSDPRDVVEKIDPASGERTQLTLPKEIQTDEISGLAVSNAGHLLVGVPSAVWALDVDKNKAARVCVAPEGATISGIGYDPNTSSVYVIAWADSGELRSDLWVLPKNAKTLQPVVNRRAGGITGFTFLKDGRIVFASRGDLWIGTVSPAAEEDLASLEGIRFAPVGLMETANATSNSYGAREVVALGDGILVRCGRLGGSGGGDILQVPVPAAEVTDATLQLMAETLGETKTIGQSGTRSWICGTPKGTLALYITDGGKLMRLKAGGEPEELADLAE